MHGWVCIRLINVNDSQRRKALMSVLRCVASRSHALFAKPWNSGTLSPGSLFSTAIHPGECVALWFYFFGIHRQLFHIGIERMIYWHQKLFHFSDTINLAAIYSLSSNWYGCKKKAHAISYFMMSLCRGNIVKRFNLCAKYVEHDRISASERWAHAYTVHFNSDQQKAQFIRRKPSIYVGVRELA